MDGELWMQLQRLTIGRPQYNKFQKCFQADYNLLKTYPNPFNPFINIEIISYGEMITDVSIVSLNGQYLENIFQGEVVNSKKIISWNPNNLSSGIYLVRLVNDKEQRYIKKLHT